MRLETGDILLTPCTGLCGKTMQLMTGCTYVHCGIYDKMLRKVHEFVPFIGKRVSKLYNWNYALVLRYRGLPEWQKMRIADDCLSLLEALASEYPYSRFNKYAASKYVIDMFRTVGYPIVPPKYIKHMDILWSERLELVGVLGVPLPNYCRKK